MNIEQLSEFGEIQFQDTALDDILKHIGARFNVTIGNITKIDALEDNFWNSMLIIVIFSVILLIILSKYNYY